MIWQPKDKFLPGQALKPEWNARWKSVSDAARRSGASQSKDCDDEQKYFIARGSFNNPREIPPHYRYADEDVRDVGASELARTYERIDYGFVVEHRWEEKLTNIVTFHGFHFSLVLPSTSSRSSCQEISSNQTAPLQRLAGLAGSSRLKVCFQTGTR
jgi:hypothetical protein